MLRSHLWQFGFGFVALTLLGCCPTASAQEGVFVRMKLVAPEGTKFYVKLGGHIHNDPWHFPPGELPAGAEKNRAKRTASGVPGTPKED